MSESAALKYTDISKVDNFRFIFHCQHCGAGSMSENYAFNIEGIKQPMDENTRALLWIRQHRNALERARGEAKYEFSACPSCGRLVCGKCFHMDAESGIGSCIDCSQGSMEPSLFRRPHQDMKRKEDETHMLTSVTRQYKDFSTPEKFAFTFYCDRCGKEWRSDTYTFDPKGFATPIEERIRTMLWNQQHEEAYERANREVGARFSRCPLCGCRICDDCLYIGSQDTSNSCKGCGDKFP